MPQVWQRLAQQYGDTTSPFSPSGMVADQSRIQQQVQPKDEEEKKISPRME
jgi:hypothetical protein